MAAKLARSQRTASGSGLEPGRLPLKVGDLLANKYRVERVLGSGGMGVVVEAYHELLDQRVAVKLLYQDVADREAQSRLLLEARASAKLQSDHVARVVDVDVGPDGLPFIVMELLEGSDLCQVADQRGALPRWLVVDYMLQALEGLAHAHARGIIHRDLKPSNLFLTMRPDGSQIIKVFDFGISKSPDVSTDRRQQQLTGGGTVLGSPPYMSPEQVRSPKSVDHRTDIWALGICMYELLTNSMPFGGEELQETFAQILEKEPLPIRAHVTGVPEGLEQVVMRCLAKNRAERYQDVSELAAAIAPFGSGSWVGSADRVQGTLARALMEDLSSGMRLRGNAISSANRIPIPSSRPRPESVQPGELHGTAATVASTFKQHESKRRWLVVATVVVALLAVGLGGFTIARRQRVTFVALPTPDAPPTPVPVDNGVSPPPPPPVTAIPTALADGEPPPNATLLGASSPGLAPVSSAAPKKLNAPAAIAPHPTHAAPKPAVTVTASKKEKAQDPVPGLPLTRSGQ